MPLYPWERWDCIGVNPTANRSRGFTAAQTGYYPETLDVLWTGAEAHYSLVNNLVKLLKSSCVAVHVI